MTPYKLSDWNDLIDSVNSAIPTSPPDGCPTISPLGHKDGSRPWLKSDVQQVLDKLMELCPDNDFSGIDLSKPWAHWLDEISAAVTSGCCGPCCKQSCCPSDEVEMTLYVAPNGPVISDHCHDTYPTWPTKTIKDLIDGLPVARPSVPGLDYELHKHTTNNLGTIHDSLIAAGAVGDDGKIHSTRDSWPWDYLETAAASSWTYCQWGGGDECVCGDMYEMSGAAYLTEIHYTLKTKCATYGDDCV